MYNTLQKTSGLAYFVSYLKTSGLFDQLVVIGRKRLLRLTSTHLKAREILSSLVRIGKFMKRIFAITEQLDFDCVSPITYRRFTFCQT